MKLNNIEKAIISASNWLFESGIQNVSDDQNIDGSFNAWFKQDSKKYPYIYAEITGYMVTTACYLYHIRKDESIIESGKNASDWLLNVAYKKNMGFRCLYPLDDLTEFVFKHDQMYTFDCGVIINSLLNIYRIFKEEKYLRVAIMAADWLVDIAQKPSGSFEAIYQIDTGKFIESDQEWSMCSGSYHAKIAIGLLNLYDLTNNEKYIAATVKLCDFVLRCQNSSGRFISFLKEGGTNAHPHCYTAEGLWVAGKYLSRDDYLFASKKATEWLFDSQNEDGYIARFYMNGKSNYNERIDALIQSVRLGIIHFAENRLDKTYINKIIKTLSLTMKYQVHDSDKSINGGFYWGKTSNGKTAKDVNPWVTAFFIQTAILTNSYLENKWKFNPFHLI